jgi:hypothetical protein
VLVSDYWQQQRYDDAVYDLYAKHGRVPGQPHPEFGQATEARVPGLFDLGRCIGKRIGISVNGGEPQWTRLAMYQRLGSECTTLLTLAEPITVPWVTDRQLERKDPPTQFRLYADPMQVVRLDEPRDDDDTAVVW